MCTHTKKTSLTHIPTTHSLTGINTIYVYKQTRVYASHRNSRAYSQSHSGRRRRRCVLMASREPQRDMYKYGCYLEIEQRKNSPRKHLDSLPPRVRLFDLPLPFLTCCLRPKAAYTRISSAARALCNQILAWRAHSVTARNARNSSGSSAQCG